jgi:hypothetical protein
VTYSKVCTNVLREVADYLPEDKLVPGVYKSKMVVYNAATGLKMNTTRPESIAPYSTFCVLDRTFAVTFQGVPPHTSIVRLDMIRLDLPPRRAVCIWRQRQRQKPQILRKNPSRRLAVDTAAGYASTVTARHALPGWELCILACSLLIGNGSV